MHAKHCPLSPQRGFGRPLRSTPTRWRQTRNGCVPSLEGVLRSQQSARPTGSSHLRQVFSCSNSLEDMRLRDADNNPYRDRMSSIFCIKRRSSESLIPCWDFGDRFLRRKERLSVPRTIRPKSIFGKENGNDQG